MVFQSISNVLISLVKPTSLFKCFFSLSFFIHFPPPPPAFSLLFLSLYLLFLFHLLFYFHHNCPLSPESSILSETRCFFSSLYHYLNGEKSDFSLERKILPGGQRPPQRSPSILDHDSSWNQEQGVPFFLTVQSCWSFCIMSL